MATKRDHDRDVPDHKHLPDMLRDPRLSRELPSQKAAQNATGAVKLLIIVIELFTNCDRICALLAMEYTSDTHGRSFVSG